MNWHGVDRIIDHVKRNSGYKDLEEGDIIAWTAEAMGLMEINSTLQEHVAFVEVRKRRAPQPTGLRYVIQIARNNCWKPTWSKDDCCVSAFEVDKTKCKPEILCPEVVKPVYGVATDCNGNPIHGADLAYYRPYFDLVYEYEHFNSLRYYRENFTPVRLANHSFFNSLVCQTKVNLASCVDQYSPHGTDFLFSFESGQVAIAYLAPATDERGCPLVPDHQSFRTAIGAYISHIKSKMNYEINPERYEYKTIADKAESDWHWYCGQAKNWAFLPQTVDEFQNLAEQKSYLIPPDSYYGFFGNLGRPEQGRSSINGSFVGTLQNYEYI